ncbi:hypothetical protein IIB79_12330, partial [candidate division KSB1 bacterium]|nr:hypothetical protein [candidate division KSB1 bacterium]
MELDIRKEVIRNIKKLPTLPIIFEKILEKEICGTGAIKLLIEKHEDLINKHEDLVEKHNGKWLKEMGDGAMAQFSSALDAVN